MARLTLFFISLFALFFLCARLVPTVGASTLDDPPIADIINTLEADGLISHIHITISVYDFKLDTLVNNRVTLDFDAKNPVATELTLDRATVTGTLNDTVWVTFDQHFNQPVVVPSLNTTNSGPIPNASLTQGAIPFLDIIPLGILDLNADLFLHAGSMDIPIQITGLKQTSVPTTYDLLLG
ncbi:hypothetical protein BDZ94DRAFT_1303233 [Collybia nuda]|uniref:Uncharacterized protein n=1 Tax=Collybia nuda TaxID=64659 RepID=A0A9P6CRE6_9AGAR|nr:hypothetical protein BDZ94DRAFT_1303233 [Collybia nuda]